MDFVSDVDTLQLLWCYLKCFTKNTCFKICEYCFRYIVYQIVGKFKRLHFVRVSPLYTQNKRKSQKKLSEVQISLNPLIQSSQTIKVLIYTQWT